MELARLSPAEIIVLQRTREAPVRHMLRLTFADLVLRDVLRLEHRPFQPRPQDAPVDCYYVRPGDAWGRKPARPHEVPLLRPLPPGRQMVLLRNYVAVLLEQMPPRYQYRLLVTESPGLRGCVRCNAWQQLWQSFALTPAGQELLYTVGAELAQLPRGPRAAALLPSLHGKALLLGAPLPFELRLFDEELLRILGLRRGQPEVAGGDTGGSWDADNSSEGSDFGGLDFGGGHSGGGGASGDFGGDSGCSSGCSGCSGSGCSGCGGCGGD